MSIPTIYIDPYAEVAIVCCALYYNIPGFYPNVKALQKACKKEGYGHFRLKDITKWLENQCDYQIYRHPPKIKAQASFSKCRIHTNVIYYLMFMMIRKGGKCIYTPWC